MQYEPVIGLEIHAELLTRSKMFCGCPVLDLTQAPPNSAVCPVCSGMPGTLPVVNRQAVELALRVALALQCQVAPISLFARKNYFYPDLPKGYQISQYEYPLAQHGKLPVLTADGERVIRIRRVHLEEDTGKLTHISTEQENYSLVDLNRAGVPLLEIVTEPDIHTLEELRAFAETMRHLLRVLGVNSGDMEKGVIRFEANVSLHPMGSPELGTRVEIKNLNSFRALIRATAYQIEQQERILQCGGSVTQETLGWDDVNEVTFSQRSKEEAHDYRYFPEPDLPPLVVESEWLEHVKASLPELPFARLRRFQTQYGLSAEEAALLLEEYAVADYFEEVIKIVPEVSPRVVAGWVTGELFAWLNRSGERLGEIKVSPAALGELLQLVTQGEINLITAKTVLDEMLRSGYTAGQIVAERGLKQISDTDQIAGWVAQVLAAHPRELESYLAGKETLANWFFGQVMRLAGGRADPKQLRQELESQLRARKIFHQDRSVSQ